MSDYIHRSLSPDEQAIWGIPAPNWEVWKTRQTASLWQAAALLCELDPNALAHKESPDRMLRLLIPTPKRLSSLLALATGNIGNDSLKVIKQDLEHPENSEVDLTVFATWAHTKGIPVPQAFPWRPVMDLSTAVWPWGTHQTKLLRLLALAADRFWREYDPSKPHP